MQGSLPPYLRFTPQPISVFRVFHAGKLATLFEVELQVRNSWQNLKYSKNIIPGNVTLANVCYSNVHVILLLTACEMEIPRDDQKLSQGELLSSVVWVRLLSESQVVLCWLLMCAYGRVMP